MVIEWSHRARADLRNLKSYIAEDSSYYARRFIERIITAVEKLEDFLKIGRPVPEAEGRDDVRELIYRGYRIICLIQPKRIFIHGSRNLAGEETKPWETK